MKRRFSFFMLFGFLALAAGLFAVTTVYAQEGQPESPTGASVSDDAVNAIAKELYCPVCPNTPLDVCETQACKDWRAQIKDQLSQGWSEEQIVAYFVNQYGERVLAEPQRKGFTSMVWVLPVIAVLFGVGIVGTVLKSWRSVQSVSVQSSASPAIPQISDELRSLIENEIRQLD